MISMPSRERLHSLLTYEPDTGILRWRARPLSEFDDRGVFSAAHKCKLFNARKAGKVAGMKTAGGYIGVRVDGRQYFAHRVIWKMQTGRDPSIIDHINRNTRDNRWANLREADKALNARNSKVNSRNTSGITGVGMRKDGRWVAQIGAARKTLHLGIFATVEEAVAARRGAERVLDYAATWPDSFRQRAVKEAASQG